MNKKFFQLKAKIELNRKIQGKYFMIFLKAPAIAHLAKPGQFIEVKVSDNYEPFLRRPLSIHRVRGPEIEILYEVVGKGTEILSRKKAGEYLDIIGPLGNGFRLNRQTDKPANRQAIIVAGGIGIAPLFFLVERLKSPATLVLIGARTKTQLLCKNDFKKLGCDVKISTDDGSEGFRGKVTDLLKVLLRAKNQEPGAIYACGPEPMLKEIQGISKRYNIPTQVSLEAYMACGFGVCLGCTVETASGNQRVCREGPVFCVEEIIW